MAWKHLKEEGMDWYTSFVYVNFGYCRPPMSTSKRPFSVTQVEESKDCIKDLLQRVVIMALDG